MQIMVIGVGYVGLVSSVCFAQTGYQVIGIDNNQDKVTRLNKAQSPIYEIGLDEMLKRNIQENRLRFSCDYNLAKECDLYFIAVDTPSNEDGSCDRSRISSVLDSLSPYMKNNSLVVMKSTASIGTCQWIEEELQKRLLKLNRSISFHVASNPEFLKEGSAIQDFLKPDRVIIGTENLEAQETLKKLYAPFNFSRDRMICVDCRSSEMIKYASNTMLACRISFMNELAGLCEKVGADINKVRLGMGSDQRIGHSFLYAGAGWGGSCFPKDIRALRALCQQHHYPIALIDAIEAVNERQKHILSHKITEYFQGQLQGKELAIWGLAFKPNTDDVREAPSLTLIDDLTKRGVRLRLYDPVAMDNAKKALNSLLSSEQMAQITFVQSEYSAAKDCDGIVLITEWPQFRSIDFAQVAPFLKTKVLFDGRNQYEKQHLEPLGIDYLCIGKG